MKSRLVKKAFTLVELLVVTGIIGVLLAMLLVGFRANEDTQIRQAADILASAIRNTQTLAISSPQGAALVIVADNTGTSTAAIWQGDVLPTILATASTVAFSSLLQAPVSGTTVNANGVGLGYQMRFSSAGNYGPWSPWFGFAAPPSTAGTIWSGTVFLQPSLGQSGTTAVTPLSGQPMSCEIAQRPMKTQVVSLPKLAVIDTRWSSVGNDVDPNAAFVSAAISTGSLTIPSTVSPYRNSLLTLARGSLPPGGGTADIALCFDRTGALTLVVALPSKGMSTTPYAPFTPTAPIYFLVTGVSASTSAPTALDVVRSSSPIWVAVDPATGSVQTGKNQAAGTIDLNVSGKGAVVSRIDAYFRSLRATVFPAPFLEAVR